MGALTFDALLRSLKQGVPDPVYYLHGDEDVLKDEAVRALVDRAVDPAARDFNLDQRSAPELDAEAFHALVNTPPMLATRRAVVVRGLEQLKKTAKLRQELLRYLESPNPTTLLVLVQAAGGGGGPAGRAHSRAGGDERCAHADGARHAPRGHGAGARRARSGGATGSARSAALVAPARGPAVWPRELGGNGGPLGPLGRALERARARAGPAARAGRGPGPQVEHADRRGGNDRPAGLIVRRARSGGGVTGGRADRRTAGLVAAALALSGMLPVRLSAQTDTLRAVALRVAQTRPDSGRAMMRRLLARLSPQDSLYPGALFTAGMLAPDAGLIATNLQRVVVEYGRSVWADSALVALTKLYFAQGDLAATTQAVERLRRDYPDSPLRPRADFTGARAYFDLKDDMHGCALVREALDGAGADVEFKNQVSFYAPRCAAIPVVAAAGTPATVGDTQAKPPPPATATIFAVQVLAVKSASQVDEMLTRLKVMGFDARVVRDTSGLFKVRVGRYATHDEAAQVQRRLKTRLGGQPFVVEEP